MFAASYTNFCCILTLCEQYVWRWAKFGVPRCPVLWISFGWKVLNIASSRVLFGSHVCVATVGALTLNGVDWMWKIVFLMLENTHTKDHMTLAENFATVLQILRTNEFTPFICEFTHIMSFHRTMWIRTILITFRMLRTNEFTQFTFKSTQFKTFCGCYKPINSHNS